MRTADNATNRNPTAYFNELVDHNLGLIDRIAATLRDSRDIDLPRTWAECGDQNHYRHLLQQLSDMLHREGEYGQRAGS